MLITFSTGSSQATSKIGIVVVFDDNFLSLHAMFHGYTRSLKIHFSEIVNISSSHSPGIVYFQLVISSKDT